MSPDSYDRQYWSVLRGTLDSLLHCAPGTFKAISYEQMYSAVYKCVCRQMSEKLYEVRERIYAHNVIVVT